MIKYVCATLVALAVLAPTIVSAEDRWQWEVRGDIAESTKNVADADIDTGAGVQATLSFALGQGFGLYSGVDFHTFQSDTSFAGDDVAFSDTGYVFGVQWDNRFNGSNLALRLRAGATYSEIHINDDDFDDEIADSNYGVGWELGVDLSIGLPNKWVLTPGIRYRELSRNIRFDGRDRAVDLEYVTLGLGFGRTF